MRTYTIEPHIKTFKNGTQEQQGFAIRTKGFQPDTLKVTHAAVELCETAILRYEAAKQQGFHSCVYGKDWTVNYTDCAPEQYGGINPTRLSVYNLKGVFNETT